MNRGYLLVLSAMMLIGNGFSSEFNYNQDDVKNPYTYDIDQKQGDMLHNKKLKGKTYLKKLKYKDCNNNECKSMEDCNNLDECEDIMSGMNKLSLCDGKKNCKDMSRKYCNSEENCNNINKDDYNDGIGASYDYNQFAYTRNPGAGNSHKRIHNDKNIDLKTGYRDEYSGFYSNEKLDTDKKELDDLFGPEVQEEEYLPNKQDLSEKYVEHSNIVGNQDMDVDDLS